MNLTQVAALTKRSLAGGVILMFVIVCSWIGYMYYKSIQPKPVKPLDAPEVKFGVLPKLDLPEASASANNYTFSLDTETGNLPSDLPYLAKVYISPILGASFLASDNVKQMAKSFGFTNGPQILSSNRYRFFDSTGGSFTTDLDSGNFSFNRRIATDSGVLDPSQNLPDSTTAGRDFKDLLKSHGLLKDWLVDGATHVDYNKVSQFASDQATVWLGLGKIDDYDIITPSFDKGLVHGTIIKSQENDQKYIDFHYDYWDIDTSTSSTYPIKKVADAYQELKDNKGIIFFAPPSKRVSVSGVRLAYYQPDKYTSYIQPIFVFVGQGFAGIVPAVIDQYLGK